MLPLIAIAAFFILGIAFFIFGKDDFGLKGLKGVSNETSTIEKEVINPELEVKNESNEERDAVTSSPLQEAESTTNISD
tara:strand:- start:189 stop:425 length:237 start_codon:yes stop_codon:yes gene_type:complete